jgi:hypothetical protein
MPSHQGPSEERATDHTTGWSPFSSTSKQVLWAHKLDTCIIQRESDSYFLRKSLYPLFTVLTLVICNNGLNQHLIMCI